jgi:vancomycin resistance protein YoaR
VSPLRWTLAGLLAVVVGVSGGVGLHFTLPESPYVRGLVIGGHRIPEPARVGSWLDGRRQEVQGRTLILRAADRTYETTFGEVGIDLDLGATLAQAAEVGHRGSLKDRVAEARRARRGEVDVPFVYRFDENRAAPLLDRIEADVAIEPVDARLDIKERRKIPDVPGRALVRDLALAAIAEADKDGVNGAVVDLPTTRRRAKITEADLVDVDVTKVLSMRETTFATYGVGVGRTVNIKRAASFIDGVIIPPGQTISFNELVGRRTLERGFTWAPEIQGDEMTTGVGGGTCQVSSTLFMAALFGAMDIIERKSHSRPSSYAKLGLDATVSYPTVDLKIKNPFSFPVMIHVSFPKPGTLRVEILGGDPAADVTYSLGIGGTEDFVRRITVKPHLKPGTRVRHQKGSPGYDVSSVVTIKWKNGATEERRFFSGYRPAPEIFWVAPDYNVADLPPLPDRAKGVEGQLASIYDGSSVY